MKTNNNNNLIMIELQNHEQEAVLQLLKVLREPRSPDRYVALVVLINGRLMSISRADPRGLVSLDG